MNGPPQRIQVPVAILSTISKTLPVTNASRPGLFLKNEQITLKNTVYWGYTLVAVTLIVLFSGFLTVPRLWLPQITSLGTPHCWRACPLAP
jgi:hypothetical protein